MIIKQQKSTCTLRACNIIATDFLIWPITYWYRANFSHRVRPSKQASTSPGWRTTSMTAETYPSARGRHVCSLYSTNVHRGSNNPVIMTYHPPVGSLRNVSFFIIFMTINGLRRQCMMVELFVWVFYVNK